MRVRADLSPQDEDDLNAFLEDRAAMEIEQRELEDREAEKASLQWHNGGWKPC